MMFFKAKTNLISKQQNKKSVNNFSPFGEKNFKRGKEKRNLAYKGDGDPRQNGQKEKFLLFNPISILYLYLNAEGYP